MNPIYSPDNVEPSTSARNGDRFAQIVLPHLDSAYNLARWLTRREDVAEDLAHDACIRAMRALDAFRGSDGRPWLLAIVRNVCFDWLARNKHQLREEPLEDSQMPSAGTDWDPQIILLRAANAQRVRQAIEQLPTGIREVIVLREMEELSYKEIAAATNVPIGTVMSRLARGRRQLQSLLSDEDQIPASESPGIHLSKE